MTDSIPDQSLAHAVVLFETPQDYVTPFTRQFGQRFPDYDPASRDWTTRAEPRPCTFGPLAAADWQFHLLFDPDGMSSGVAAPLSHCRLSAEAQAAVDAHRCAALLFLEKAPDDLHPWQRMQTFTDIAKSFFDLGASVIIFPMGLRAWHRSEFKDLPAMKLEPKHFAWFVDWRLAGETGDNVEWVRTHGLSQFDLPDLAWTVPAGSDPHHGIGALAAELFEAVPPYLIDRNEPFGIGDWINLQNGTWDVVAWADIESRPELSSKNGTQIVALRRDCDERLGT